MFYIADSQIDQLLSDDIQHGDLTTRALGIGQHPGNMVFIRRQSGRISGLTVASRLLTKLSLNVTLNAQDGHDALAGDVLLTATGSAAALHQGWKVTQNVLEWSCGVAGYMAEMVEAAKKINPAIRIACTRKSIPGTKFLAIPAVIDGGGIIHRGGTAETVLMFANHRHFFAQSDNWHHQVSLLRTDAPEKKIIVEADTMEESLLALQAQPDILQLDKFSPPQITELIALSHQIAPHCLISVAGGVNRDNIQQYAETGVELIVTSAPYYAIPADIKVVLQPTN